jgi:hypothetical protein
LPPSWPGRWAFAADRCQSVRNRGESA